LKTNFSQPTSQPPFWRKAELELEIRQLSPLGFLPPY